MYCLGVGRGTLHVTTSAPQGPLCQKGRKQNILSAHALREMMMMMMMMMTGMVMVMGIMFVLLSLSLLFLFNRFRFASRIPGRPSSSSRPFHSRTPFQVGEVLRQGPPCLYNALEAGLLQRGESEQSRPSWLAP